MNQNGENFKKELEELCQKYDVTLFAGMFGVKFNFRKEEDAENNGPYYAQNFETKEMIVQER